MDKRIFERAAQRTLTMVCLVLVGAGMLLAQGTRSSFTGVVTDATGAVIPNASVTITNEATGVNYNLKTNSAGVYDISALLPGRYTIQAAAKGFRTYVDRGVVLTTDQMLRVDVMLEVGAETQTVTVEAEAPMVSSEGRLSALVTASQVQNMPLNGRDVYQLMQLIPGAVNSTAVDFEATAGGIQTNINGARANFNGFLYDGVSNKGLSGGSVAQPAPDFVQEFSIQTNNFSAEFGNSAGSITDVSTKAGTNSFHGDAWEYIRNDKLNARNFFDGANKAEWRQNQFGASVGGPIKRDKLFFFGGYEGERFRTASPAQYAFETPAYAQAVQSLNSNSVASLLLKSFPAVTPTSGFSSVDALVSSNGTNEYGAGLGSANAYGADAAGNSAGVLSDFEMVYTDPCFINQFVGLGNPALPGGPNWGNAQNAANQSAKLLGVTPIEQAQIQSNISTVAGCSGFTAPAITTGLMSRDASIEGLANASFNTRTKGVFYNGDQFTGRMDYQGDKNRIFGRYFFLVEKDPNFTFDSSVVRGFNVPFSVSFPAGVFSLVHNFSPTVVNEVRVGFTRDTLSFNPPPSSTGVPSITFDTGEVGFGAYNGYPQFFNENIYNYKDMVSVIKGKHSLKIGGEFKRNIENSEFNVGRPSYYFFDIFYFANDQPYGMGSGVNPEITSGSRLGHLDTNIRSWRNYEESYFVQDDWKVKKNLTLNFGLRYDYYAPHTEKYHQATRFNFAPGASPFERLANVNCSTLFDTPPGGGTCTGGFGKTEQLFPPDKNNFSPRFGFAWDPFGRAKTSIRGGFAVFYESTFYNSLSNSRWNLPFYSFNTVDQSAGILGLPVYGPFNPDGTPNPSATPTFLGPPNNPGQGPPLPAFAGNIMGWWSGNQNLAALTGIPDPTMRSPYVENGFLGIQQELTPTMVLEVNWVGTAGHKLMWAENINRLVGGKLRDPSTVPNPCTGGTATKKTGVINPCFGRLRVWKNSANSIYNGLQVSLNKKISHGITFTSNYVWSHSLDLRSSWHGLSGGGSATEADPFGSSGYSLDPNRLYLERASSLFDIRHRFVTSLQWELPWLKNQAGVKGKVLGGWTTNYNLALQTGFPFTVGARSDFNKDGIKNDRPDIPVFGNSIPFSSKGFEAGSGPTGLGQFQALGPQGFATCADCIGAFPKPAAGADGNLGRNTFRGPAYANIDFSLFKTIPLTESLKLQFRTEVFNIFNHTNLYQPHGNLSDFGLFGLSDTAFDPREIQFALRLTF